MSPIVLIGGSILLLGIGIGLGYLFAAKLLARDAKAVSEVQDELDEYRRQVTEHFGETAQHFQALGKQYQSLHRHLAQGAGTLCDPAQANALLELAEKDAVLVAADSRSEAEPVADAPIDYVADGVNPDAQPEIEAAEAVQPPEDADTGDGVTTRLRTEEEVSVEPMTEAAQAPAETAASSEMDSALPTDDVGADPVPSPDTRDGERTVH